MNRLIVSFIFILNLSIFVGCQHVPIATRLGIALPDRLPPVPKVENVRVALVLGGGGSKGLAHVGVLEALEKAGIPIDLIVGCSSGSAIGALYSSLGDASLVKERLINLGKWDLLDLSFESTARMVVDASGPVSGYYVEKFIRDNIVEKNIEELPIPFAAVAVDIECSKPYIFKSGPIAPAIHASSALPPFFSPVFLYQKKLVDGGVLYPVPVAVAKEYNPKVIIAVDISSPPTCGRVNGAIKLLYRSLEISYYELCRLQSKSADIDIHPNMEGFGSFDDSRNVEIYQRGLDAANASIPAIKEKLKQLGIPLRKVTQ